MSRGTVNPSGSMPRFQARSRSRVSLVTFSEGLRLLLVEIFESALTCSVSRMDAEDAGDGTV